MRRSEIIEGANQIIEAIDKSHLIDALRNLMSNKEKDELSILAMKSIKEFLKKSQEFNVFAKQLIEILNLDTIENPEFWVRVINPSKSRDEFEIHDNYSNLVFAKKYLPKILRLLDRDYSNFNSDKSEPIISNGNEMKLLSVTIFESENRLSSPQRLINVLESVNTFYTSCAYIHEVSPDTLSVIGCDSGSDKSFDFLGVAKVIECVTQLIENLWDRVVFYREKQLDVRLDLINKSLPIYEKINDLEAGKKLEPELAERLRRNISDGVNKFVESGASIPEIDVRPTYSSRSLLSPVQKLLVSSPEEMEDTENKQDVKTKSTIFTDLPSEKLETNNLSSDEQSQLLELVKKMKESPESDNNRIEDEAFEIIEGIEE